MTKERLLTADQIARLLPPGKKGGTISRQSVWRWTRTGLKIGQSIIRLGVVETPSGRAYTKALLDKFLSELTEARSKNPRNRIQKEGDP